MPDFPITDPQTGKSLIVTGPQAPGPQAIAAIFADYAKQQTTSQTRPDNPTHIGPDTGGLVAPNAEPVTLADLIHDPKDALRRMVAITKAGLSDPRNTLPLAIGVAAGAVGLGPRSFASTRPALQAEIAAREAAAAAAPSTATAPEAPRTGLMQAVKDNVSLDDVAGMMPSPIRAGYRVAKGIGQAVKQAGRPTEPAAPPTGPAAAPSATPAAAPPAPPSPTATPPPPARAATASPTPPAATATPPSANAAFPSLEELQLTPAEITTAVKWHESGVAPETILHRILQSRQLTAKMRTETPDQAAAAVRRRNETGKWPD